MMDLSLTFISLIFIQIISCTGNDVNSVNDMSANSTFLYFGYGSNLLAKRILIGNPTAVRVSAAKLNNYRLDFFHQSKRWNGASATIVEDPSSYVWGALWRMNISDLEHLDNQEGVHENIYKSLDLTVENINGDLITCRCYQLVDNPKDSIFNLTTVPMQRRPSKTYLDIILAGARETELPNEYINVLSNIPHNGNEVEFF